MAWTYGMDPENSALDAVRLSIGDTDSSNQLLQDEEINYMISTYTSVTRSAYHSVLAIVAKLAILHDQETGRIKVWASKKHKQYSELAKMLKSDMERGISLPSSVYAGGISHADIKARDDDVDQVRISLGSLLKD